MVRKLMSGIGKGGGALGPRARGIFDRLFGGGGNGERDAGPRLRTEAATIAIASGKGGTGKSFLATSIAILAHQRGKRTTLVDCDFGLACDHLLLGVTPTRTLQHLLAGQASLDEVCVPTRAGPRLVPGSSGVRQMAALSDHELAAFGRRLGDIARDCDLLVLDCGAGIAPQTVLTMLCADRVVLVTQPEIAALTDAYAVVKCLVQLNAGVVLHVVVNRVAEAGQGERAFTKLEEVSKRHTGAQLRYLGEIRDDPLVTQRRLGQEPLVLSHTDGRTAAALRAVLDALLHTGASLDPREVPSEQALEARFREHRLLL